jgi:DNA modification methylase
MGAAMIPLLPATVAPSPRRDWSPAIVQQLPLLNVIHVCSALTLVRRLPDNCINCVVTSPPYWMQRKYGAEGEWGSEPTLAEYIGNLVMLFREIRRVLHPTGTVFLNLGDKYNGGGNGTSQQKQVRHIGSGKQTKADEFKNKDLMLLPHRVAIALQDDGWYVRQDNVWNKPNPMPESVEDRTTRSHEYVFLLTKNADYWYDKVAVQQPVMQSSIKRKARAQSSDHKNASGAPGQKPHSMFRARENVNKQDDSGLRRYAKFNERYEGMNVPMGNLRSVWTISPKGFKGAHFATFPKELPDLCIRAGCPPQVCACCGAPFKRHVRKIFVPQPDVSAERGLKGAPGQKATDRNSKPRGYTRIESLGWKATCSCHADARPGVVFDPFMGSGTTAVVAVELERYFIGTELKPDYAQMARERVAEVTCDQETTSEAADRPAHAGTRAARI